MNFIPATDTEKKEMLEEIGIKDAKGLFRDIDPKLILKSPLNLSGGLSEIELRKKLEEISGKNRQMKSFLGAGCYNHFIPSVVDHIISRSEFYTAYTPYQPEISQGALQSIFEFQTYICRLTGMDVANASMYDGSSALAEAAFMAHNITNKSKIIIPKTIHPEYRKVVKTYCSMHNIKCIEINYKNGIINVENLKKEIDNETAAVIVQNPNFFGCIEDLNEMQKIAKEKNALLIVCVVEANSLGLLEPPRNADIVAGDGQSFGIPPNFGGPAFGFMAVKKEHLRKMPGRLVGMTKDKDGKEGFILTLQAREQHIRREKATSNICTNQALMALAATVYLSMLGKQLKDAAYLNLQKAHYAYEKIKQLGIKIPFNSPFFNEFVIKCNDLEKLFSKMKENNIVPGFDLGKYYPELKNHLLINVTEMHSREDIDNLIETMERYY
ncbi:aminomethyl-transferring glycine dehydrogenase subunit GcvPA [Candidatus Woesearchaeota archaeon]|nr:aminomethyl-transferring glycine dehydrogenase subunit GcvPA [Candidatus Woesearchaeota archaeon]